MTPFDAACRRWRPSVVRAVPSATDDFITELTAHIAQRWLDALAAGRTEPEADRIAHRDLAAWTHVPPPERPGRRRTTSLARGVRQSRHHGAVDPLIALWHENR